MASYSIPVWELVKSQKAEFRKRAIQELIKQARLVALTSWPANDKEPLKEPPDLDIRELRADDLGLQKWQTPNLRANEYVSWVKRQILPSQVIIIYAVTILSSNPHVTTIRASNSNFPFSIVEVEKLQVIMPLLRKLRNYGTKQAFQEMYDLSDIIMEAYLSEAWVIRCTDELILDVFSPVSAPGDKILFRGFVCEPKGITMDKQ